MNTILDYDNLRNLVIGSVNYVSTNEIKILLEMNAPDNVAINTGTPTFFPRINGYVLIPNELGALVGIISWMGIEYSQYPKRKGLKDFDLIDLPYPLRKMSINPLGLLKQNKDNIYEFERGVYTYPSVGDKALIPTQEQVESIVKNKEKNATVTIGYAPIASYADVKIDPNKLFGRHLAVLGNTGSGKSCSVSGLIRWSLEEAKKNAQGIDRNINARFIILDPNGEYSAAFDDFGKVRKFKVKLDEAEEGFEQLKIPAWMWNSSEWSSIVQASGRTQKPILKRALREIRGGNPVQDDVNTKLRRHFTSYFISLNNDLNTGISAYIEKPGRNDFGRKLQKCANDAEHFITNEEMESTTLESLTALKGTLSNIAQQHYGIFNGNEYYNPFERSEVEQSIESVKNLLNSIGGLQIQDGPNEDSPIPFDSNELPDHIERLAQEQGVLQYLDFLIMRIRTMLTDTRMGAIINNPEEITLDNWLDEYVGSNEGKNGEIGIIDLSLVPTDVIHLVIAVISRMVFEGLQRYRRINGKELPTVMVLEEAHTFISRHGQNNDELSSLNMCSQTFERIAREGRKFGLGLVISSQRPSELSPTVLSQCNTFLLHRIVNDKDQELVRKLVPDNLGSLLNELPVLPTKQAILLGLAAPIPTLVEMRELSKTHQPQSSDAKFWEVWTGKEDREIDWRAVSDDWQDQ